MGSNGRSGLPLTGRAQAQPVWVDLAIVLGRADSAAAGIVTAQPAAGDLSHWLRTADGAWVGVVTYVATLTDGTKIKCAVGMFLRAASGLHRWQHRLDDRPLLVAGIRRVPLRPVVHPATVDQVGGTVTQARRPFSNSH